MHIALHVCFDSLKRNNRNIFCAEMFLHFTLENPVITHVVFLKCSLFIVDVEQILIILIVYVLKTHRYLLKAFQRFLSCYRKKMERHGESNGRIFTAFLITRLKGSSFNQYGSPHTTILDVIVITSISITIWINAYNVGYKCCV